MSTSKQDIALHELIAFVAAHPESSFYRERWGKSSRFEDLPFVTSDDFVTVPLSRRRYKQDTSLVKIVRTATGSYLSEWSFDDISREPWGIPSKRPMVYMEDPHEALEKSVWCYERGMLPLIGEKDPDIAAFGAKTYRIDALITDPLALPKLQPYLAKRDTPLETLTIVGHSFDTAQLAPLTAYTKRTRLVLALPEVGAFAEADFSQNPTFAPLPGCIVERDADAHVVTKLAQLTTPIIKYRTAPSTLDIRHA